MFGWYQKGHKFLPGLVEEVIGLLFLNKSVELFWINIWNPSDTGGLEWLRHCTGSSCGCCICRRDNNGFDDLSKENSLGEGSAEKGVDGGHFEMAGNRRGVVDTLDLKISIFSLGGGNGEWYGRCGMGGVVWERSLFLFTNDFG